MVAVSHLGATDMAMTIINLIAGLSLVVVGAFIVAWVALP
jgi:hypothetical protein